MTTSTPRLLSAAAAAAVLVLSAPGAAHATFPGRGDGIVGSTGGVLWVSLAQITAGAPDWREPRLSADGTRIFAVRGSESGTSAGVWSMRPDGTDRLQITDSAADRSPAPFPDGQHVVVVNDGALWSVPVRPVGGPGTGRTLLFQEPALPAAHPEVSPDGRRVAFDTTSAAGVKYVWVLDVATLTRQRLTGGEEPSWSPDGTRIAFSAERGAGDTWDVLVMKAVPGSKAQNLTASADPYVDDREPKWSPDGREIAFRHGTSQRLSTIRLDTGVRELAFNPGYDEAWDWGVTATVIPLSELPCTIVAKPQPGIPTIQGTPGRDVICGSTAPERIDGGGGNDVIRAGGGDDVINGGAGDDWIDGGDGDDVLDGGAEGDVLRGGSGRDTVTYASRVEPVTIELPDPDARSGARYEGDTIADDVEVGLGGTGADVLASIIGDHTLIGGDGADALFGGTDDATLDGGDGDDYLYGAGGADKMQGGDGTDTVSYEFQAAAVAVVPGDGLPDGQPGEGDDVSGDVERLIGGDGDDRLEASKDVKAAFLDGGRGDDVLVGGRSSEDTLLGGPGADVLDVAGDDLVDHAACGSGDGKREPVDEAIVDAADVADQDCERITSRAGS
jgi:hypothetical protein